VLVKSKSGKHGERKGLLDAHLGKAAQQIKSFELQKLDRQRLRLPKTSGYSGSGFLDDLDEYLSVIFEHRRPPVNESHPESLLCLEGTNLGPLSPDLGPGVGRVLRIFQDNRLLKQHREIMKRTRGRERTQQADHNPLGAHLPSGSTLEEDGETSGRPPSVALQDQAASDAAEAAIANGGGPGIFFQTEPELADDWTPSMTPAVPPPAPLSVGMTLSASMPALPKAQQQQTLPALVDAEGNAVHSSMADLRKKRYNTAASRKVEQVDHKLLKTFHRVMPGKSLLVLTDRAETRKDLVKVIMSVDASVFFVKSQAELCHQLHDAKEQYHAAFLDLTKPGIQADQLCMVIRQHPRYCKLPVIVIAAEMGLSQMVRSSCSFVVFMPLVASMVRKALLWCFHRKAVQAMFETAQEEDATQWPQSSLRPGSSSAVSDKVSLVRGEASQLRPRPAASASFS